MTDEPLTLEHKGWDALSSSQEAARAFYDPLLRGDALMIFPGGLLLEGKAAILDAIAAQPWQSFDIQAAQVLKLSEDVVSVFYRVTAQREGNEPYKALISSTYVLSGNDWQLVLHQQTPA